MDAHAHLRGLGWRGTGFSLDSTDRGLAKPILVTHKFDGRGLGSRSQKEKQADLWWLNAFDSALKNLENSDETALQQVQKNGYSRGGLYGFFVRGETLGTTFSESEPSTPVSETEDDTMAKRGEKGKTGAKTPRAIAAQKFDNKEKSKKRKAENETQAESSKKVKITNDETNVEDSAQATEAVAPERPTPIPAKKQKKDKKKKDKSNAVPKVPNEDSPEVQQKMKTIAKEVKAEIHRRELAQEFGPKMPNPAILLRMEKAADEAGPEDFPFTDLAKLSVRIHGEPEPGKPYKKVKYKAEKIKRESKLRVAKRDLIAQKYHLAFGTPYPIDSGASGPKRKQSNGTQKSASDDKVDRTENTVDLETIAKTQDSKPEKASKKKDKKRKRQEETGAVDETVSKGQDNSAHTELANDNNIAVAPTNNSSTVEDNFATGADEIKVDGEVKLKKKKQKGLDISSETLEKEATSLIEEQRDEVRLSSAEQFFADTITQLVNSGDAKPTASNVPSTTEPNSQDEYVAELTKEMTPKEIRKIRKAAAQNKMTMRDYVATTPILLQKMEQLKARKEAKKARKERMKSKTSKKEKAKETTDKKPVAEETATLVAVVTENKTDAIEEDVGFVVDTEGDNDLVNLHPSRTANLNAPNSKAPKRSKIQREKDRNVKKMKDRNKHVAGILSTSDKPRDQIGKDEVKEARKQAKNIMKVEKRKKRDKAMHRPKPGASLVGVYGA